MYFWAGVSAIAGALRRKVWFDQAYFKWYPNFYIVFVAPPGIVSKSTTAGLSMNLLKRVPGIRFGPDVVTWQALVTSFAESAETFEYEGMQHTMSPLTLESSEFGNLLDPKDKAMVDLLVSLWDGKPGTFEKKTKNSGNDSVENPWINLIACTTPSWIAGNFPEYMIGGGFTSRCVFVYANTKNKYVAYPGLEVPLDLSRQEDNLIADLEHIANNLTGQYQLSKDAVEWGRAWYHDHYTLIPKNLNDEQAQGYIARKQSHLHKLAMILTASRSDELVLHRSCMEDAYTMLTDLEPDMVHVFGKIGRTETAMYTDKLIGFIQQKGKVEYTEAYRYVHSHFPSARDFDDVVSGCIRAGFFKLEQHGTIMQIVALRVAA